MFHAVRPNWESQEAACSGKFTKLFRHERDAIHVLFYASSDLKTV